MLNLLSFKILTFIFYQKENYKPPTEPFIGITKYVGDFPAKYAPLPNIQGHPKVTQGQIKRSSGRFEGRTMYKVNAYFPDL